MAYGISLSKLHMRVTVHSPNPPLRAVAVRDVSLSQLAPRIHQFANCHHARPAAAVWYHTWVNWYLLTLRTLRLWDGDPDIAGRLFNGLTANYRWHQIYRSQQRSLSLGKELMLAETVAQTDGQTFPIIICKIISSLVFFCKVGGWWIGIWCSPMHIINVQ